LPSIAGAIGAGAHGKQKDSYAVAVRASPVLVPSVPPITLALHFEAIASVDDRRRRVVQERSGGAAMKKERIKDRISEREYHGRLKNLPKNDFNPRLEPLKSLKTATKKRRELKKKVSIRVPRKG
jgi:hypothetical protein